MSTAFRLPDLRRISVAVWVLLLACWMALAPSVVRLAVAAQGPVGFANWVCTTADAASGAPTALVVSDNGSMPWAEPMLDHCPWCLQASAGFALPPAPYLAWAVVALPFLPPAAADAPFSASYFRYGPPPRGPPLSRLS